MSEKIPIDTLVDTLAVVKVPSHSCRGCGFLMITVIVLSLIHALLSGIMAGKFKFVENNLPLPVFLGISIVVNIVIVVLAIKCLQIEVVEQYENTKENYTDKNRCTCYNWPQSWSCSLGFVTNCP